jgi:hypothetical protein
LTRSFFNATSGIIRTRLARASPRTERKPPGWRSPVSLLPSPRPLARYGAVDIYADRSTPRGDASLAPGHPR